ncbi:AAA family ATPase [Pedobacter africanus]|uniref:ATPase family associated with various cellular activities (AAA) n=1 Tax=Pedobacter africanus TaxID=151894 RepID=A0A1W2A3K0_9SPHI|nr:ATP-binding protein [Pedobacter africanus]SMC55245.1 ATPase family associated with various cellular activities (AAA) [Pedobacter africanus]
MNIYDLVINDKEKVTLNDIILEESNRKKFVQLVKEHAYIEELSRYGLPVNNKILLQGSSGCGKTMSAKAIANALGKNILILNLSNVVCSRIGETSQSIKQVFDQAAREKAVLFLDEFDQIGKARGSDDKDVGEMRRLVNTLIQLIDYYPENALLLCATNHPEIIDAALLRRFQLRINFEMPTSEILDAYYDRLLSRFPEELQNIERKYNISYAEARDHTFTLVKGALIKELEEKEKGVEA